MKPALSAVILSVILSSCSSVPQKFTAADTSAVHSSISDVKRSIASASSDAGRAKIYIAQARELGKQNAGLVLALDQASSNIDSLTTSLLRANKDAELAETKLAEADKKNAETIATANKVSAENEKNKAIVKQVNSWWGLGGVFYGIKRLAGNLLILVAVLIGLALILFVASFFFPFLAPIFAFIPALWRRLLALLKPKPPT